MKSREQNVASRIPALFIGLGLIVTLVVLLSAQSLLAQDDTGVNDEPTVYHLDSLKDPEEVPAELREYLRRQGAFQAEEAPDFTNSTKSVSRTLVYAGEQVTFQIHALNSGDGSPYVTVTDTLPAGLTLMDSQLDGEGAVVDSYDVENNTVTWKGWIPASGYLDIELKATVDNNVTVGQTVENKATIAWLDQTYEPAAQLEVGDPNGSGIVNLPYIVYSESPIQDITGFGASRPNSQNNWTVSWNPGSSRLFELQEAQFEDFSDAISLYPGTEAMFNTSKTPSAFNTYYYRVRGLRNGEAGNWSDTVKVVGGYYDDFSNNIPQKFIDRNIKTTQWDMRRTSYIEEVRSWYELNKGNYWYILQVEDRWDLGLTSPLKEGPSVPYYVETEVQSAHLGNQKGLGLVFAGDKPKDNCPMDTTTASGWYEHHDCFNHWYEIMTIFDGNTRSVQVIRVDSVRWDEDRDGIKLDRTSDADGWYIHKPGGLTQDGFNVIRVEVRENRIDFFTGKRGGELRKVKSLTDPKDIRYLTDTYFGMIVTTDEYSNATGRYEYFTAMPLDN